MAGIGGGFIFDMIARLKANEALRKRRSYFKNKNQFKVAFNKKNLVYKHATAEQLEQIRKSLKHQRRKELIIDAVSMIIAVLITAILIHTVIAVIF